MTFTGKRQQFKFWLDHRKTDEQQLADYCNGQKSSRGFSRTIRDALRLLQDLQAGSLTVLLELFPNVEELILTRVRQRVLANDLVQQLERIEAAISQLHVPSDASISRRIASSTSDLDFDLEITATGNTANNNSTWNFAISSALMVYGNCDSLPTEIVEYGLNTGRIKPDQVHKKSLPAGPKAMDVPKFEAPQFDDLNF